VALGAENLDLGPVEVRLGLASGEQLGPLGQVFGYWAPDLWPAQVFPSLALAHLEAGGRPTSASVRWPAALAGMIAGFILVRRMSSLAGGRAGVLVALCWFGSLALIDRSADAGIDLIVGLGIVGAIDRLMDRGSDALAGCWASLAFLAGGWPPLVVIMLAIIVLGRSAARLSLPLLLPPVATIALWSVWTVWSSSAEVMSAALALPLTHGPAWMLALGVLLLGLPWSPFAFLVCSSEIRGVWNAKVRAHLTGWLQVACVSLVAGTIIPGLSQSARITAVAGLAVVAAGCLDSVRVVRGSTTGRRMFFVVFATVVAIWLAVMAYGSFTWCVSISYYRPLGIVTALCVLAVAGLAWEALAHGDSRRAGACLIVVAIGLKLVHWGYYVPEWNYRRSQGPWARAIAQWMPRNWTLYTTHEWPADLAFYLKRPVRRLHSPHFLRYQPGPESKYVLLLPAEFDNWPNSALAVSLVARFQDQSGGERILARTAGVLPPPLGPNRTRAGFLSSLSARR
jgi:hypothetical protein